MGENPRLGQRKRLAKKAIVDAIKGYERLTARLLYASTQKTGYSARFFVACKSTEAFASPRSNSGMSLIAALARGN